MRAIVHGSPRRAQEDGQRGQAGSHLQAGGIVGVVSPNAAAAAAAA